MTVGAVNDAVMLDIRHISAYDKLAAQKVKVDMWNVLQETFEMRAKMLHEETQLYSSGYFMTNIGRSSGSQVRDTTSAKNREALDSARKQRGNSG